MESFRSLWFLLVGLATLFRTGYCTHCYKCTSATNPKCNDPFGKDVEKIKCNAGIASETLDEVIYISGGRKEIDWPYSNSFNCLKYINYQTNQIVRGCTHTFTDKNICIKLMRQKIGPTNMSFCQACEEDGCNGSNRLSSSVSLTAMLLPIVALYCFIRQ